MNIPKRDKFLIGLTGTIGSGKSLVSRTLTELGADVIDADVIAREVVEPGTEGLERIVGRWGGRVLSSDGTLNREAVSDIVFNDESERIWLNGLLHPIIGRETARRIAGSAAHIVVLEAPLLFESGMDKSTHENWLVIAREQQLVERIMRRDNCTRARAEARIRSQMSQEEKKKLADVVIDNSGTESQTRSQVEEAWRNIEKL